MRTGRCVTVEAVRADLNVGRTRTGESPIFAENVEHAPPEEFQLSAFLALFLWAATHLWTFSIFGAIDWRPLAPAG